MTRLFLLRHAKAKWAEPGSRDYDRALDETGKADAAKVALAMQSAGYLPELVLCSGAKRARETWEAASGPLGAVDIRYMDGLYSSDAGGYLDIIREAGNVDSVLVIGHNPMLEDLALALSRKGQSAAMAAVARGFPTSGVAALRFTTPFAEIAPVDGYLEDFLTPAGQ